jgi:DNA-binding HxlR family transcriptional regulator
MEAHVYNTLKTFYRGNGDSFKAPFDALKRRTRIRHGATLAKALIELEQKGWVEVVRYAKHGKRRGLRVKPNEYRLTFKFDAKRW